MEIRLAKLFWLRYMQRDMFSAELISLETDQSVSRVSPLYNLVPYLDHDGLIRIRRQLRHADLSHDQKHQIVLRLHHLVKLMISECQLILLHGGPRMILTYLRREFWILRHRPIIRAVLHR